MTRQSTTLTRQLTPTTSPLSRGLLQRKCACGQQTIAGGECEACQKKRSPLQRRSVNQAEPTEVPPIVPEVLRSPALNIQPMLKIGQPNDQYEQEADRVADQVMGMSALQIQPTYACGGRCPKSMGEQGAGQQLQTKPNKQNDASASPASPIIQQVIRSPGQALDLSTRKFMGSRFGHDFSQIRVHFCPYADEAAHALNARAFTLGHDIVFGAGQYAPNTMEGRHLLAHELAHTVQQGASIPHRSDAACLSSVPNGIIQKDDKEEDEARRRRERSWLSNWRFQLGVGPMRAPSPSGAAASFFPPTQQLPIPGFLLNRGLGLQYSEGRVDFGVFPNLGSSTDFYGTRDIPRLLNLGSSSQSTSPTPQLRLTGQTTTPITPTLPPFLSLPVPTTTTPSTGIQPRLPSLGSLRERTIDRFIHNQSSLPTHAADQLDNVAARIRLVNPLIIWVTGHADETGGEQYNQTLSEARAASVRQALIDRGVDASSIESTGDGELNPLVPDATTQEQHARNRRVTIEWFDSIPSAPPASAIQLLPPSLLGQ